VRTAADRGVTKSDFLSIINQSLRFDQYEIDNVKSEITIRWQSATGRFYTVQAATNLAAGFTDMVLHVPATPPVNVYTDSVSGVGCRFYRMRVE